MNPTLSIIIPSIGRKTLQRALDSIPAFDDVEVIVVFDGCGITQYARPNKVLSCWPRRNDYGSQARNLGIADASGKWLAFLDDDDYFTADGVNHILDYCRAKSFSSLRGAEVLPLPIDALPAAFKMQRQDFGDTLWRDPELRMGNVGGQQFVCPNRPYPGLPKWQPSAYEADFYWMVAVSKMCGGMNFVDKLTVVAPKANHGR